MTEEFDAFLGFDFQSTVLQVLGIVLLGIALEWGLRYAHRRAEREGWIRTSMALRTMFWLPIFWCTLLVALLILEGFSEVSAVRRVGRVLVQSLLVISIAIYLARVMVKWVRLVTSKQAVASSSIFNYLINAFAVLIVLMAVLFTFNVSVPVIILTFLGSTLGLSVALREPLSNLFAGLVLTASGRISPGDFIRLPSGQQGRVTDIEWDVTLIRQLNEGHIIVPNSIMSQAEIINFDWMDSEYVLPVDLGVDYDSDLDQVEHVTIEVADNVLRQIYDGVLLAPSYIWYKSFEDSDIQFTVYLRCRKFGDNQKVKHEFLKQINKRYAQEGIVMPYPTFALQTQNKDELIKGAKPERDTPTHAQDKDING